MKKVVFVTTFAVAAFAAYPAAACEPEPAVASATDQAPQASPTCSGVNCGPRPPTSTVAQDVARGPATGSALSVLSSNNRDPANAWVPIVLSSNNRGPAVASVPIVLSSNNRGPAVAPVRIVLSFNNAGPGIASVPIVLSSNNREPAGGGFTLKLAFYDAAILADAGPMLFRISNMSAVDEPE